MPADFPQWAWDDLRERVAGADHPNRLVSVQAQSLGQLIEAADTLAEIYRVTPIAELQDERVDAAFDRAMAVLSKLIVRKAA